MGIHHAEGWQKKKVSELIHEQGQKEHKRDAKQANAMIEKLEAARTEAKAPKTVETPHVRTPAKPVELRNEQASARDTRGEVHEKVKQHGDKAASNFIQARDKSRGLSELLNKAVESKSPDRAATREAAAQKDPGAGVQTAKNQRSAASVQQSASGGQRPASSDKQPAARDKRRATSDPSTTLRAGKRRMTNDERRATSDERRATNDERRATSDERRMTSDERRTTSNEQRATSDEQRATSAVAKQPADAKNPTVAVAGRGIDADDGSRFTVHEKKADAKKKGEKSGQKAGGVYADKSGASRELSALLDGFGPGGGDTNDGAGTDASPEIAGVLPEKDPDFHVYNDDGINPVGDVKSKALVFEKRVEKKLKQIAKLDREVDGMIRDLFETQSLSTRIVGEIADELRKELNTARFLYGTVYGGLIG